MLAGGRTLVLTGMIAAGCADPATGGTDATSDGATSSTDPTTSATTSSSEGSSTGTPTTVATSSEASTADTSGTDVDPSDTGSTESSTTDTGTIGDPDCAPVLSEIFYDADAPNDDELQWIEIHNPCSVDFDLATWSLGYARGDAGDLEGYTAGTKGFTLQPAVLAAGGCFVVGGPTQSAANGDPDYDYPDDFAPGLFAPDTAGAGVALFDVAAIDTLTVPRDALVYGPNNTNLLVDETGMPIVDPHAAATGAGESLQRTSVDATWEVAAVPTPNECPRL
jgi:hypothetical protein